MAKTSESTLRAIKKYNQKSKFINLKYTPNTINDYNRVYQYCSLNDLSLQGYIKALIKADLDSKGFYLDNDNDNAANSIDSTDTLDISDTDSGTI